MHPLHLQAVSLALQCLSFDFVGKCLDESAEDLGTIQVPSTWRPIIEQPSTLQLFLDFYAASSPPLSLHGPGVPGVHPTPPLRAWSRASLLPHWLLCGMTIAWYASPAVLI